MLLDPLCDDCPFLAEGHPPACWACDRTRPGPEAQEALEIHWMLGMGMPWELALEAAAWTGTPDDLRALAARIAIVRSLQPSAFSPQSTGSGG